MLRLLALSLAGIVSIGMPLRARAMGPFDYRMEVTPEEGHVDPKIDGRYTAEFSQCQKRAKITSDHAACFEAEFQRQDAKLNETWRATQPRLSADAHRSLLEAQRKWIRDRDPFCMKDADRFSGGTIAPLVYVSCRVELTIRRTLWLEALVPSAPVTPPLVSKANAAKPNLDGKLKAFLQGFARSRPYPVDETLRAAVATVDLRGDGAKETLVYLSGRDWCGTGGCPLLVLAPEGSSFKIISKTTITRPPIRILPTRSHGWNDLGVTVAGGGIMRAYVAKLPFDGTGYAENPTVPPVSRATGRQGAIAISADDHGEPLFP